MIQQPWLGKNTSKMVCQTNLCFFYTHKHAIPFTHTHRNVCSKQNQRQERRDCCNLHTVCNTSGGFFAHFLREDDYCPSQALEDTGGASLCLHQLIFAAADSQAEVEEVSQWQPSVSAPPATVSDSPAAAIGTYFNSFRHMSYLIKNHLFAAASETPLCTALPHQLSSSWHIQLLLRSSDHREVHALA